MNPADPAWNSAPIRAKCDIADMAQQARAQVLERRRQRALLPAALFVAALLVLGFVLGVRSGAFGVVSLPLLRLLAALVAFGAVFRAAWAGAARFVLAGMALGEAVRLVLTLMRPAAERESLLLAGAELRVLLLVAGAVLLLSALDRSRSVLAEKDARLRQLLGGVLGLLVCLATPRPAVVICREPWRPSFAPQPSHLECHVIREASVCQRVPGCSVSAVCRAPRGYEDTNKPCGRFSDQQSCAAQTFCQWIARDGVSTQPCAAFTPGECPARMCRLDEY